MKLTALHNKIMKYYFYFINKLNIPQHSRGFTLTELLVGIAITGITITIAGSGLISLMKADQKSEYESKQRFNLNRALDFIADDVRASNNISSTRPSAWSQTPSNVYVPILYLTKPPKNPSESVTYVAYYIGPSPNRWRGPKAIYRSTEADKQGDWLIDSISEEGFTGDIDSTNQVSLFLQGQYCLPPTTNNICTNPKLIAVDTRTYARATP